MDVASASLDHLGIVSGVFDQLGVGSVIDGRLQKKRAHNVTHGQAVKAMILNGLGFTNRRLYLFTQYYLNLPVDVLIGEGIQASDLSDDVIGAALDAIYEYGPTKLFNEVVLNMMKDNDFGVQRLHSDSSSFSVQGDYEPDPESGDKTIEITWGHSKDGRKDLKQYVLCIVSNQHGIPLFTQAHSGNASDKKIVVSAIQNVKENLKNEFNSHYIADSAMYTAENIANLGIESKWITRAVETIDDSKKLIASDVEMTLCQDTRYSAYETTSNYAGIPQKWILFHSQASHKSDEEKLNKSIESKTKAANLKLKRLMRQEFACEADARAAADLWKEDQALFKLNDLTIITNVNGGINLSKSGGIKLSTPLLKPLPNH
jgi:transposase